MGMKLNSRKAGLFTLFMLLILISCTACLKPPANTTPVQFATLGEGQSGDLMVTILSDHNPPVYGINTLKAYLSDANGQPVSDAKLTFNFDMTNMHMNYYVVKLPSSGEGWYSSKVSFSMPGPWRVIVRIERAGQTYTVQFDFEVH
jgi:hypothetical protein